MKKWILCGLVISICLITSSSLSAMSWIKCATHDHDKWSDGTRSFRESVLHAKKCGFRVYIPTNHIEQLPESGGFQAYLDLCNKDYGITVIPGVEVTVGPSHTVVCGNLTVESLEALNKAKTIPEIIRIAQEFGLLTVAAHAFQTGYPYDINNAKGINGEEWLNDTDANFTKYLEWAINLESMHEKVFFWAGQDSHTGVDPTDKARWQRVTWVYAESPARKDILDAFAQGRTYASGSGFSLDYITPLPGFEVRESEPRLQFVVRSKSKTKEDHVIRIYRGREVAKSIVMKKGSLTQKVDFYDTKAKLGIKFYHVVVDPVIAVPTIRINITKEIPEEPVKPETPAVYAGPPFLLGKTRAEVASVLGDKYRAMETPENFRWYDNKPIVGYQTYVNFGPVSARDPWKKWDKVFLAVVRPTHVNGKVGPKASTIVPASLLIAKPSAVYRGGYTNSIVVVWYINNRTYILALRDALSRPLYTTVKTASGKVKYYVDKNTFNFNYGGVYHFAYIDKHVAVKTNRNIYGGPDMHFIPIDYPSQSLYSVFVFDKK